MEGQGNGGAGEGVEQMAMHKKYDVVASTGTYTDRDGNDKKRWLKCGVVLEDNDDGRLCMKLEAMPFGPEVSGWFSFFEPTPYDDRADQPRAGEGKHDPKRDEGGGDAGPGADGGGGDDDNLPF